MKISDYTNLIGELDESLKNKDGAITKENIWEEKKVKKWLTKIISEIGSSKEINKDKYYRICRQNVFKLVPQNDSDDEIRTFYLAILMWGYPRGGRGNMVKEILHRNMGSQEYGVRLNYLTFT